MTVVSDTSPIINLARINKLDILHHSFGGIVIPRAVYEEITRFGPEEPGASEVEQCAWITVYAVANRPLVEALKLEIDPGEAEAIACAIEMNAERLLLDERLGRNVSQRLGVKCIGLLGLLIEAKNKGLVMMVKPLVDDLIAKAGFWISRRLYARVLSAAGEDGSE